MRPVALVRRHPVASTLVTLVAAAVAAWLFFGVFAFHLVFVDDVVSEADPFAAAAAALVDEDAATTPTAGSADQPDATASEVETAAGPQVLAGGVFGDRSHPASGTIEVLTDGDRRVLRIEDLVTDNGPDLNVYLSAAPADAPEGELGADVIDLGDLKGNIGDQNYDIPAEVDLDRYSTVVIWCVRFGVAFGTADLT